VLEGLIYDSGAESSMSVPFLAWKILISIDTNSTINEKTNGPPSLLTRSSAKTIDTPILTTALDSSHYTLHLDNDLSSGWLNVFR